MTNKEPIMGNTFAQTSSVVRRLHDVTARIMRLNDNGWRQNRAGEFFWRLVVPVPVSRTDFSDAKLARLMLEAAQAIIQERLEGLKAKDGFERLEPHAEEIAQYRVEFASAASMARELAPVRPIDGRTRAGRKLRRAASE